MEARISRNAILGHPAPRLTGARWLYAPRSARAALIIAPSPMNPARNPTNIPLLAPGHNSPIMLTPLSPDSARLESTRQSHFRDAETERQQRSENFDEARIAKWKIVIQNKIGADRADSEIDRWMKLEARMPGFDALSQHEKNVKVFTDILNYLGIRPADV